MVGGAASLRHCVRHLRRPVPVNMSRQRVDCDSCAWPSQHRGAVSTLNVTLAILPLLLHQTRVQLSYYYSYLILVVNIHYLFTYCYFLLDIDTFYYTFIHCNCLIQNAICIPILFFHIKTIFGAFMSSEPYMKCSCNILV